MCVPDEWTQQDVHRRISQALETLHAKDQYLLDQDVHERTIAQRLAIYLEHEFAGWHVDCEYNRNLGVIELKKAPLCTACNKIKLRHYQTELHYRFALSLSVAVSAVQDDKWV